MSETKDLPAPPDDPESPYGLIFQSYVEGKVNLGLKYLTLNQRKSPVFSRWENIIPYAFIVIIVANYTYEYGYVGFCASLLLSALVGFYFIPKWLAKRVRTRALTMALTSEEGWDTLWAAGGLGLRLTRNPEIGCDSPDDDWRAFVTKYLKN
ncbi:MAG TPA: hypothetical protein VGO34_06465 [Alphaproteobacteria bacterium]|jgi:hypothetical protein